VGLEFELRALSSQSITVLFELYLQSILPRLASNLGPPELSLPSSWDYRSEPLAPSFPDHLNGSSLEAKYTKTRRAIHFFTQTEILLRIERDLIMPDNRCKICMF
jgi:hypothetical protein